MELVVLVGLPGSGKSSFFRERFAHTHVHISKDLMRNVRNRNLRQAAMIREALVRGKSAVVDNTNPSRETRAPIIAIAQEFGARSVAYFFDETLDDCIRRNANRHGRARVPNVAIHAAARRLEPPAYAEGFDRILRVTLNYGEFVTHATRHAAAPHRRR